MKVQKIRRFLGRSQFFMLIAGLVFCVSLGSVVRAAEGDRERVLQAGGIGSDSSVCVSTDAQGNSYVG